MIIKGKTVFIYDVEVFPNFFSVATKNTESGNIKVFQISELQNDIFEIVKIFLNKKIYWCGFNSVHFDSPIISYIIINYNVLITLSYWEICKELKEFADLIITSENSISWKKYKYAKIFDNLDLLTMHWSEKLRVGLKSLQVTMEYPNVEEYSGDFNALLSKDKIKELENYNINDILSTEEFLNRSVKDIELRLAIEEEYHISALNKDGVNLGMEILKTRYLQETGLSWNDIKDLRSPCNWLCLNDIIFDYIEFKTPTLQKLLKELKEISLDPNDNSFEKRFILGGVVHNLALGGLHSESNCEKLEPSETELLEDQDVTSLYPSIIIENNLYPAHLGEAFVKVYKQIKDERVQAKKTGNKLKNETLKLSINGCTGNFQNSFSWVYDPKLVLTIRMNGQLMLLMYIERLVELGAKIINSNTDGVFFMINKSKQKELSEITKWWEEKTHLGLETDVFERFYQYAVNDYIGVKAGWSQTHDPKLIKKKGLFIDEPIIGKGLAPLIIPEALNKYFVEGISPEDTIYNCKDIKRFVTFQKVSKDFEVFYGGEKVTHINRYYMSLYGKPIYKQKFDKSGKPLDGPIALCADSPVTIYNKFDNLPIESRKINYHYYLKEVYKIIEKLDKKQLSLF